MNQNATFNQSECSICDNYYIESKGSTQFRDPKARGIAVLHIASCQFCAESMVTKYKLDYSCHKYCILIG